MEMAKHSVRKTPKNLVVKMLKILGLSVERKTVEGDRVWAVSDGKYYGSIAQVYKAYHNPKDKRVYAKIKDVDEQIKHARGIL